MIIRRTLSIFGMEIVGTGVRRNPDNRQCLRLAVLLHHGDGQLLALDALFCEYVLRILEGILQCRHNLLRSLRNGYADAGALRCCLDNHRQTKLDYDFFSQSI